MSTSIKFQNVQSLHCIVLFCECVLIAFSQNKLDHLAALAARRKAKLMDNSAYLQFMWKADVVESWIADKETHVRSEEFGRDLSTVQTLLTKQETFDAGENKFIVTSVSINVVKRYPHEEILITKRTCWHV